MTHPLVTGPAVPRFPTCMFSTVFVINVPDADRVSLVCAFRALLRAYRLPPARIGVRATAAGRARGAYLNFGSEEEARCAALALQDVSVDGRKLVCALKQPLLQRPALRSLRVEPTTGAEHRVWETRCVAHALHLSGAFDDDNIPCGRTPAHLDASITGCVA